MANIVFFILLPNSLVWQIHSGLDNSWQIGFNLAIQKKLSFGKDYVFTYGPLGFIVAKYTIVVSKWIILIFELLIIGCVLFILRYILRQSGHHPLCYIIIIPTLLLFKSGNFGQIIDIIGPIFLFFIFYFLNRQVFLAVIMAAIISVFEFYCRINYGIVFIILLYTALFIALYKKILTITQAFILSLAHIVSIYLLSYFLHVSLIAYIISGLHLINDYNDAMYIIISVFSYQFIIAILVAVLFIIGFIILYRYYLANGIAFFCYLFGAFYLYLLFKNGFVRADGHIYGYFSNCTFIFGLMWVFEKGTVKKIWAVLTCFVLAISISFVIYMQANSSIPNTLSSQMQVYLNFNYFKDIFTDVSYKNKLPDNTYYWGRIPQKYLDIIGHSTVDIIPTEISELYYNNLNYDPRPIEQSYSAYDEYLDRKNYGKYISATAPDYIIYSLASIDNRYPFWDESITKTAMLTNYKLDDVDSIFLKEPVLPVFDEEYYLKTYPDVKADVLHGIFKNGLQQYNLFGRNEGRKAAIDYNIYLLLKKREKPLKITIINETPIKLEIGKEYNINSTSNLLYLFADLKYNLLGKIRRFLFQPPPLYVILTYDDGRSIQYEAILPILKTGVLLNQKIETISDAAKFFDKPGVNNSKIISFRFEAESGFNPEIDALIKEVKTEQ